MKNHSAIVLQDCIINKSQPLSPGDLVTSSNTFETSTAADSTNGSVNGIDTNSKVGSTVITMGYTADGDDPLGISLVAACDLEEIACRWTNSLVDVLLVPEHIDCMKITPLGSDNAIDGSPMSIPVALTDTNHLNESGSTISPVNIDSISGMFCIVVGHIDVPISGGIEKSSNDLTGFLSPRHSNDNMPTDGGIANFILHPAVQTHDEDGTNMLGAGTGYDSASITDLDANKIHNSNDHPLHDPGLHILGIAVHLTFMSLAGQYSSAPCVRDTPNNLLMIQSIPNAAVGSMLITSAHSMLNLVIIIIIPAASYNCQGSETIAATDAPDSSGCQSPEYCDISIVVLDIHIHIRDSMRNNGSASQMGAHPHCACALLDGLLHILKVCKSAATRQRTNQHPHEKDNGEESHFFAVVIFSIYRCGIG